MRGASKRRYGPSVRNVRAGRQRGNPPLKRPKARRRTSKTPSRGFADHLSASLDAANAAAKQWFCTGKPARRNLVRFSLAKAPHACSRRAFLSRMSIARRCTYALSPSRFYYTAVLEKRQATGQGASICCEKRAKRNGWGRGILRNIKVVRSSCALIDSFIGCC